MKLRILSVCSLWCEKAAYSSDWTWEKAIHPFNRILSGKKRESFSKNGFSVAIAAVAVHNVGVDERTLRCNFFISDN